MKALTVWQPWSTLIIIGAKPYEFRRWNYAERFPSIIDMRIAIHAGARPMRRDELMDIADRLDEGESALDSGKARAVLDRLQSAAFSPRALPLACVLGTAVLGRPVRAFDLFKDKVADSSRLDQHIWAWPLTDIVRFDEPVPYRGAQGFWEFPDALARAA
jgi:hypothetical protein